MASGSIAVKDEATAKAWIAKCNQLNQKAHELNNRVGAILKEIELSSEGDVVLKLVQAANSMIEFATRTLEVMGQIANEINRICDSIIDAAKGIVDTIVGFFG